MESGPDSAGGRANLIPQAGGRARIRVSSRRQAADLIPGGGPANPDVIPQVGRQIQMWFHRWAGVRGWSGSTGGPEVGESWWESTGGPEVEHLNPQVGRIRMMFDGVSQCTIKKSVQN